jgi:hypothetical protein
MSPELDEGELPFAITYNCQVARIFSLMVFLKHKRKQGVQKRVKTFLNIPALIFLVIQYKVISEPFHSRGNVYTWNGGLISFINTLPRAGVVRL